VPVDSTSEPQESDFDLMCCECGKSIRLSREIEVEGRVLPFYADELGLENTDFHFHVPH